MSDLLAEAAATAAATAPTVPVLAATAPVVFALAPSARDDALIDYSTKEGIKKFEKAVHALTNAFDGKSENMTVFKGDLKMHANNNGWDNLFPDADIISIPTDSTPVVNHNIITKYSQISIHDIRTWASYTLVNQQVRAAQNNANMYQCLYNTLTPQMLNKMLLIEHEYTMPEGTKVAALFYKCIMGHACVDTEATISLTRQQLATLDQKMLTLDSNIMEFNIYVQEAKLKLAQYGATSEDLLVNLFRGYKAARDNAFNKFICDLERDYLYGERHLTADQLMTKAITAYQVEVDKSNWGALSADQQMIVAMQTELKSLKDSNLKLDTRKKKDKGNGRGKHPREKGSGKKKTGSNQRDSDPKDAYAWKLVAPQSGQPTTKQWKGKTYHFCPNHNEGKGKWVLHTLAECNNTSSVSAATTTAVANSATIPQPGTEMLPPTQSSTTYAQASAAIAALGRE